MGHEFMGIVEAVGASVAALSIGDRVIVPFPIACGHCFFCGHGLPAHCEVSNPEKYGPEGGMLDQKGGGLFGYSDLYGGYPGGQAEYVRVPFANFGPRKAPEALSDDQVLFLTDIFPTAYAGLKWTGMKAGETVTVLGCGPVGLMAQKVARALGASQVIGVDIEDYRLETARRVAGSTTFNAQEGDVVERIRELSDGRGTDICIDAVGMEAHRSGLEKLGNFFHAQAGSVKALETAIRAVRRGGRVGILGVYGFPYDNFPVSQIFDKGLQLSFGQATVQADIDELIPWVEQGRIQLDDIITHRLPIDRAPHAYEIFNEKKDECVKVVLKPAGRAE
jgi:threonine dehydrogenase-like Zn-dependent dehydrogenase